MRARVNQFLSTARRLCLPFIDTTDLGSAICLEAVEANSGRLQELDLRGTISESWLEGLSVLLTRLVDLLF